MGTVCQMYAQRRNSGGGIDRICGSGATGGRHPGWHGKQILLEQRDLLQAKIAEMQETLRFLDTKIDRYEQWNSEFEKNILKSSQ